MTVTYNSTNKIFTLGVDDLNFAIPETWESAPTPAGSGILGNDLNNLLTGDGTANTTIDGGNGDDTIIGGAGGDTLRGSDGIDTLSYATAVAGVNVTLNSADGTVTGFGVGAGDQAGDNINGFENLTGSGHADSLNGNSAANRIDGGGGHDILVGKGGNDTLVGGLGADDMQGLADDDLYYVDNGLDYVRERGGEGSDTVIASVSFNLYAQGNGEVEVLAAAGGHTAIDLTGSASANRIIGNSGDNVIDGWTGADTLEGAAGNDIYHVDSAGDVVTENAGEGTDLVNTKISYSLTAHVENLTALSGATNAISLNGNALNNSITGNEANNVIDGGVGADTLMGGAGDDVYYVDNIGDIVIDGVGTNTIYTTITYASGQFVGQVVAIGSNALSLSGNDQANTLTGNAGANRLNGGKGNDILFGGAGKDTFVFDSAIGTYKTNKFLNLDRIQDFKVKEDKIHLDNAIFKKLGKAGKLKKDYFASGTKAKDKNDYLVYNKSKGILSYDADGSGKGKAVEIMKFDNKAKLAYTDFLVI
jgi:Ca2+-binding RTX toxin-like protein